MKETMATDIDFDREFTATVEELGPLGYGNADSKISYQKQHENGELSDEVDARAAEIIQSGEMMRDITDNDDGCIDGRPAVELLYINQDGEFYTKAIDDAAVHERAKVAGGGYITGLAMKRAIDMAGEHVDDDIKAVADTLAKSGVYCGAHTGAHSHDSATDCGANDKIDNILANGVLYREEIGKNVEALLEAAGLEYDESKLNAVFGGWSETLDRGDYFNGSNGASRFSAIEDSLRKAQETSGDYSKPVAVSKHLAGDHKEDYIVINYVDGKTFSQAGFRKKLAEEFPEIPDETRAQAFVVDVPRIIQLAKAMTSNREADFETALYAGVAYQLATAATLTDGTLRTFTVR